MNFTGICAPNESGPCDYCVLEVTFSAVDSPRAAGDGSQWRLGLDTIQPGITAFELAQVLAIRMTISDGIMGRIKNDPWLLRHFRRVVNPA